MAEQWWVREAAWAGQPQAWEEPTAPAMTGAWEQQHAHFKKRIRAELHVPLLIANGPPGYPPFPLSIGGSRSDSGRGRKRHKKAKQPQLQPDVMSLPTASNYLDLYPAAKDLIQRFRARGVEQTPVAVVNEYAVRMAQQVVFEMQQESLSGGFRVEARLVGKRSPEPIEVGWGRARNKQLGKQVAAAALLEQLLGASVDAESLLQPNAGEKAPKKWQPPQKPGLGSDTTALLNSGRLGSGGGGGYRRYGPPKFVRGGTIVPGEAGFTYVAGETPRVVGVGAGASPGSFYRPQYPQQQVQRQQVQMQQAQRYEPPSLELPPGNQAGAHHQNYHINGGGSSSRLQHDGGHYGGSSSHHNGRHHHHSSSSSSHHHDDRHHHHSSSSHHHHDRQNDSSGGRHHDRHHSSSHRHHRHDSSRGVEESPAELLNLGGDRRLMYAGASTAAEGQWHSSVVHHDSVAHPGAAQAAAAATSAGVGQREGDANPHAGLGSAGAATHNVGWGPAGAREWEKPHAGLGSNGVPVPAAATGYAEWLVGWQQYYAGGGGAADPQGHY